jgi:hypothetical protein
LSFPMMAAAGFLKTFGDFNHDMTTRTLPNRSTLRGDATRRDDGYISSNL